MADIEQPDYTKLTVQLLSAYVANNIVASEDLASLIQSTRAALIAETVTPPADVVEHVPAVSIRKSIASREHILSLIDGRPYKTLKRHLATHGLTPADYRARYALPENYPMVAQAYSEQRRAVAQKLGLGQRGAQARAAAASTAKAASAVKAAAPTADIDKGAKPAAKAPKVKATAKPAPDVAEPAAKASVKKAAVTKTVAPAKAAPAAKTRSKSSPQAAAAPSAPSVDTSIVAEPVKAKAAAKAQPRSKTPRKTLGIKSS
jgi:predicted transcriptional regulator